MPDKFATKAKEMQQLTKALNAGLKAVIS